MTRARKLYVLAVALGLAAMFGLGYTARSNAADVPSASAQAAFYPVVSLRRARVKMRNYTADQCYSWAGSFAGECVHVYTPKCTRTAAANTAGCEDAFVVHVVGRKGYWYGACSGWVWRELKRGHYRKHFSCTVQHIS